MNSSESLVQNVSQPTQPDRPSRLDTFRAQLAEIELVDTLRAKARRAFNTGNPEQSALCITEHLNDVEFEALRVFDEYVCPVCGHKLKDRTGNEERG